MRGSGVLVVQKRQGMNEERKYGADSDGVHRCW